MKNVLNNNMNHENITLTESTENDTVVMGNTEIADIKHTEQMLKDGIFDTPKEG